MATEPTDVLITFGLPVSDAMKATFQRPLRVIPMPFAENRDAQVSAYGYAHPLPGILRAYGVDKPLRIAAAGFSEGCRGVSAILKSEDAGWLESAIAIDGIHGSWKNATPTSCGPVPSGRPIDQIVKASYGRWVGYADAAQKGAAAIGAARPGPRMCVITHDATVHPTCPSTTETAGAILRALFGDSIPYGGTPVPEDLVSIEHNPPVVLTGNKFNQNRHTTYAKGNHAYYLAKSGLYVFGFNNADPAGVNDHIYQAQEVWPRVVYYLLAQRWNTIDPKAGLCINPSTAEGYSSETAGAACPTTAPVVPPTDIFSNNPPDASIDWKKYFAPGDDDNEPVSVQEGESSAAGSVLSFFAGTALGLLAAWGAGTLISKSKGRR